MHVKKLIDSLAVTPMTRSAFDTLALSKVDGDDESPLTTSWAFSPLTSVIVVSGKLILKLSNKGMMKITFQGTINEVPLNSIYYIAINE